MIIGAGLQNSYCVWWEESFKKYHEIGLSLFPGVA